MKILFTLAFVLIFFSTTYGQFNDFLERGKTAYHENANRAIHEQIKNSKNTTAYSVGDTKTFWRWDLTVMPPTWISEPATCRAAGARSYVFVANANWGSSMTQDDVDSVFHYLENVTLNDTSIGIVELATTYFGPIPDEIDNDEKVIFFFSALGSFGASVFDGYFSHFNQMTEAEAQLTGDHSNECEMLYMSCHPVNPTSYSNLSVLTHELQHLIHFGQDENEDSWINEGCSEFAMVLFGLPDPITQLSIPDKMYNDSGAKCTTTPLVNFTNNYTKKNYLFEGPSRLN
ncbi:MAG: hypothetical protein K9H64_22815 [Bacteroidales bacterium]|nr:hypothetical protein [Bacteroidales bacterium]MCF8458869.1 hypothetical protein [Bacteroidales bacterium]